jgi:hypothetical protein
MFDVATSGHAAGDDPRIRIAGDLPKDIEAGYVLLVHGPVRLREAGRTAIVI